MDRTSTSNLLPVYPLLGQTGWFDMFHIALYGRPRWCDAGGIMIKYQGGSGGGGGDWIVVVVEYLIGNGETKFFPG